MDTKKRMQTADYTKRFHDLMGGTRIGMDFHALRHSIDGFHALMGYALMVENVADAFATVPDLEDRLMNLPEGSTFVILRENDGLTVFASFAINQATRDIDIFVHTTFIYEAIPSCYVFVNDEDKLLLKICKDGTVEENAGEFKTKSNRETA